ncbi:MAG: PQQ-binding-like beta-propeller repeat protein, partial [Candidatus Binatus sp.]
MNATKVGILSTVLFGLIATTSAHAASLKLKINPKSLPFGKVEVDMVSAPKTLTLSNLSGASEIAIASIQIASGPFVIGTDNCSGATLAPKGSASSSCTISVTFNPASASNPKGTKESGALTITDSATSDDATSSKSPQPVKLTGTAFGIPTAGPAEWSMFQHDLSHTGLSQFSTAADTGTLKWSFATGETIFNSAPVIGQDGTIYIEAQGKLDSGRLVAVNSNGTKRWSLIGAGAILSTPAIGADGAIYSKDAKSHQLDAVNSDGTKEWSFTAAGVVTSSAAIGADGTIYFGDTDFDRSGDQVASELYAVNPNGSQKWSFHTGFGVSSSPAIGADGTIYFGSNDSNLYAVNPDGTEKWSFLTGNQVESSPAIGPD